jgi:hypothetical protein
MNREWSFYDPATGLFDSTVRSIPDDWPIEDFTPEGLIAMPGRYDHELQQVSLKSGNVIKRPARTSLQAGTMLRALRDEALRASDWTQLPDSPLSLEDREVWAEYRQALRDAPARKRLPTPPKP